MKRFDEIDFLDEHVSSDCSKYIFYSFEPYLGASKLIYQWKHILSGKVGNREIYGITSADLSILIEKWNKQQPKIWIYSQN